MAGEQSGEKTEQPTHRRLEDAARRGQYARSAEVQTVVVLLAVILALVFTGHESWRVLVAAFSSTLGHLHEMPVSLDMMQGYGIRGVLVVGQCVWPVALAAVLGGLLAGGVQSRFQAAPDALQINWQRLDPVAGLLRLFSAGQAAPTALAILKLTAIVALTYGQVRSVLGDPIFYSTVDVAQLGSFLATTSIKIILRVCLALVVIAALDYTFQFWKTSQELMMTRQELKDEAKSSEGNPKLKSRMRRLRLRRSKRLMLADVRTADVVVTNPTHLAVALRYDRRTMKAPRVVAKGARLNALQIREVAQAHQVPIIENKPLARLLFKHARVGLEVPAALYSAVAEVLAWVYRINRFRYYSQGNQGLA